MKGFNHDRPENLGEVVGYSGIHLTPNCDMTITDVKVSE